MNASDKILEKLRKLTNLKESAKELGNIGEMNAAAAGISRLLLEYNLSEEDIPTEERDNNPIIMVQLQAMPKMVTVGVGHWYHKLLSIISQHNMCDLIRTYCGQKTLYYSVVGRTKNVEIVEYLESFLVNHFYLSAKKSYIEHKNEYKLEGLTPNKQADYIRSYMTGCNVGLSNQLEKMKQDAEQENSNITALVLQREEEIQEFVNKQFSNIKTKSIKADKTFASGYYKGIKTGENTNLNTGVEMKKANQKLI